MHSRPASRPRLVVGCALVALLAMLALRAPASGASDQALPADAARAVLPPATLPSLAAPMPSAPLPLPSIPLPLPSVDLVSPPPSASLPLPTAPLPSVPLPSVPLPSVPVPSVSPLPSASLPVPSATPPPSAAPTSEPSGTSGREGASPSSGATGPAVGRPDGSLDGRRRGNGATDDRHAPTGAGRAVLAEPESASPAWTVPALAFGVPLMLVVGAVIAQLVGGAAVLGAARRMLSRLPGPTPRWMRSASDAADR